MILPKRIFSAYFLDYLAVRIQLFDFSVKTRNYFPWENSKRERFPNRCTLDCFVTHVYLF
jgi:hypothetical protein